jgi:N-acetylneuraminic acid mutarotase
VRRPLLLVLSGIVSLSGCGGGDSVDSGSGGSGGSGSVSITSPAPPQAATELVAVRLEGGAFISPTRRVCCTGSATDSGVAVTWTNSTTGAGGPATQSISYCWFLAFFPCNHAWSASVPVNLGSNSIAVTASDGDGNFATATIVVVRNPDATPPSVTATSPADLAAGVPLDASLTATFSEPMDPATLDASTFVLEGAIPVAGTVTYSAGERTATLDPAANLTAATTYTARITTGARDLAGSNALAMDFAWTFTTGSNVWQATSMMDAPTYAAPPSAVWTDTEMIVWGATAADRVGARYNSSFDTWQPVEPSGSPSARSSHLAVWTGTEMIVWGGLQQNPLAWVNDGARYDPVNNTWQPLPTLDAPSPRMGATAVWTGTEMIVWGGWDAATFADLNNGARYDPATDAWAPLNATSAPSARSGHTAIWTGSEMIVWGGVAAAAWTNTGGRYDPASNSWQPTVATGAPAARNNHAAVWTGTRMVVWGGTAGTAGNPPLNTGGRYDPLGNSWQATATAGAPDTGVGFSAVASASGMMIWGGISSVSSTPVDTGAVYNPATNQWSAIATTGAPSARSGHVAVWTGASMVVWGPLVNTGGLYSP